MRELDPDHVLRAPTLSAQGFRHGFSTRLGGVSEGPFGSLNLGAAVGDHPEHVTENHRRLALAVGYAPHELHQTSQVHGAVVHVPAGSPEESRRVQADALVAKTPDLAVAVRVADCVPVLVADPKTGHVAAIHAGWRGVAQGVVREALATLGAEDPAGLYAAIGPSIGPCCFEVGEDVAVEIVRAAGEGLVTRPRGDRPHVNLWRAVENQLRALGVRAVDTLGCCTRCDETRFFSFRRDGARSGRMVGVIVARG